MFRKVSLAFAITVALAPLSVQSLGLGEVHSKSYLNQTLDADIELLSASADELDAIKATLASVEDFKRAGIDRPFVLNSLQFEPVRLPNGKLAIRTTSREPIREPFLNFLLEVNWPNGRLVREYTILLDPPVTLPRRPPPVSAPVAGARAEVTNAPRAASPRPAPMTASADPGEYGPIQPNATLWSIARGLQVQGASVEQVMMALLDHNPDAFIDGNINQLKAGEILRIPAEAATLQRSREQAREEYLQQLADWSPAPVAPVEVADSGELDAQQVDSVSQTPSEAPPVEQDLPEAQLKLTSQPEGGDDILGAALGSGVAVDALQQELLLAREESAVARRENEALRDRVDDLEAQLEDMQRLLSLQSDELARMQQAGGSATGISDAFPGEDLARLGTDIPQEQQAAAPEGEIAAVEGSRPLGGPDADTPESVASAQPAQEFEPTETAGSATAVEPPSEPTLLDRLMSRDSMLTGVLGAGGVALLTLGGLWFRRRRREPSVDDEPMPMTPASAAVEGSASVPMKGPWEQAVEPAPGPGLGSASGAGAQVAAEELDALSEVDVYIAYGRYEQAGELLRQEIQRQPARPDLKRRLLEVYAADGNKAAFLALAGEMSRSGLAEQDPESWRSVLSMGSELAPEHPLFASAGAASVAAPKASAEERPFSTGLDFDLDLDAMDAMDATDSGDSEQPGAPADRTADPVLDFEQDSQLPPEAADGGEFDLDLDLEALSGVEVPPPDATAAELPPDTELDLDKIFAFDTGEEAPAGAEDVTALMPGLSSDDQLRSPNDADEAQEADFARIDMGPDEPETLSLDEVAAAFTPVPDSVASQIHGDPQELSLDDLELDGGGSNEVETMLDLAQIYVDMGDPDDARDILEEAMKEGDEGQQERARELLQSL